MHGDRQLIGLVGSIGSGKDTAADYLVNFCEFRRESFASSLKDAVSAVFNWDRVLLEGRTKEAREWRETIDPWWAARLSMPTLTPRWVLQYWGTEVCRAGFHDDLWIASLQHRVNISSDSIVISDCRFPNEINSIRDAGGTIVCIQRGSQPDWHRVAEQANLGDVDATLNLLTRNIHPSEYAWVGTKFDSIIDNNGTVDMLFAQLANLVTPRSSVLPR